MNAVQLVEIGGPLEHRTLPVPTVGDADVRVRVRAAGICHTDEHYRAGTGAVAFLDVQPVEAIGQG